MAKRKTFEGRGHPKGPARPGPARRAGSGRAGAASGRGRYWMCGSHAVLAALANPRRGVRRARATPEAARRLDPALGAALAERALALESVPRAELDALFPGGTVHQGVALEVEPLAQPGLEALLDALESGGAPPPRRRVLVALDQVSDPHNVGAVLRSAAAFGAAGVLAPRHGQAPETAALAKAASGALEQVPYLDAGNLARALGRLRARGFWIIGLDRAGTVALAEADPPERTVLVVGGESAGLRRLTREACDLLARLPTRPAMDQLNVSNAAAIALYELLGRAAPGA